MADQLCLLFQADSLSFRMNLDALSRSGVRIDPRVLRMGGRAVVIAFHSGEDRRVKRAFNGGPRERDPLGLASGQTARKSPRQRPTIHLREHTHGPFPGVGARRSGLGTSQPKRDIVENRKVWKQSRALRHVAQAAKLWRKP